MGKEADDAFDEDTFDQIEGILNSDSFTTGEKEYVKFQFGMSDGFYGHLWEAIAHADDDNLARMKKGFPEEVAAFQTFKRGELRRRLKAEGLSI